MDLKINLTLIFVAIGIMWILCGHLVCSCCNVDVKEGLLLAANSVAKEIEGFSGMGKNSTTATIAGPPYAENQSPGWFKPPSTWALPNLEYSPGKTPDKAVQEILDRPKQPIPLPPGQLSMFATTEFKPECCASAYSTSTGCACITVDQYDYLRDRGGNNVPYSEY